MALLTLLLAACAALPFPPAALAQTCSATSVAITGIDASTLGTNPVLTGLVDDCTTLLEDIKDNLRGAATLNWEETAAMDTWEGIWDDGITVSGTLPRVTNLLLSGRSLSGEIPAALGTLTQLELLDLRTNQLSGEIPATWGTSTHPLPNLTALNLAYNLLTGTIPPELGTLTQLQLLDLRRNQLSGEIPATWGTSTHPLPNLTALDFAYQPTDRHHPPGTGCPHPAGTVIPQKKPPERRDPRDVGHLDPPPSQPDSVRPRQQPTDRHHPPGTGHPHPAATVIPRR